MNKVKIGVLGVHRGCGMIEYCKHADHAEIVAICDKDREALEVSKQENADVDVTYYDNFDDFIKHDMDAVILANYANEHVPFAIKAMENGKHVYSEVLPAETLKEAVELIDAVEKMGKIYAYGENFCYMGAPYEMRRLYKENKIGEFEYGECEYIHNCEPIWAGLTYGDENHWRNTMYSTFYCTHSLGPIIHITGLRPVSVTGFEGTMVERQRRAGSKSGLFGIEMVTLENGGIIKSIHGHLYKNSVWYSVYGSKGRMECGREDAKDGHTRKIYVNYDNYSGEYGEEKLESYIPTREHDEQAKHYGHDGSDFYLMYNFIEKVKGNPDADTIDVYEAMDMFLPGHFAYLSILDGGVPKAIPNLRDKNEREKWKNYTACTNPAKAGDMLLPTFSKGTPEIDQSVYDRMKGLYAEKCKAAEEARTKV